MKHFWALPALLRPAIVIASQHSFSVYDDLLAYPQYEVHFSDDYVPEEQAQQLQLKSRDHGDVSAESEVEHWKSRSKRDNEGENETRSEKLEYEMMIYHDQRYLCSIPQVDKPSQSSKEKNDTLSKAELEKELARANDRGWELLAGMHDNCIYYMSGWWSYRFCYNKGVKQFHQITPSRGMPLYPPVEDPSTPGFMLGRYDERKAKQAAKKQSEERWEGEGALEVSEHAIRKTGGKGELVTRGESRYLVQKLEGGTECDLTGKERRIEIQYHCNPSIGADRISLIKETSTCAYLMVVQTPRLCNDVAFQPPQKDAAHSISCRPVLLPEETEAYEQTRKDYDSAIKSAVQEAEIWAADPDAAAAFGMEHMIGEEDVQVVGDIIIGGRAIVPEDVKIEKSVIAGGGKVTYVDTVANSWGKKLSKEDLEKLGLKDTKAVESLKKELEKVADGDNWKLDVFDTPQGREYRGIYGPDVEEKGGEAKEKNDEGENPESKKKDRSAGQEDVSSEEREGGGGEKGSEEEYYHKEEL